MKTCLPISRRSPHVILGLANQKSVVLCHLADLGTRFCVGFPSKEMMLTALFTKPPASRLPGFLRIRSVPTRSLFSCAFLHVPAAGCEITKPFVRNTRSRPVPALGTVKRAERHSRGLNFVHDFYFRINQ